MVDEDIRTASLDDLRRMKREGKLQNFPSAPEGEALGPEFWAKAIRVSPPRKVPVHLKLDEEVFTFFKQSGKGHLTKMQDVLRAYVRAMQAGASIK